MTERARRLFWVALSVALFVALYAAFDRFVLSADPGRFRWVRGEETFELMRPELFGVLLVAPLLLFALTRSLADLPWPQRVLSLLFRLTFLGLLALALAEPLRSSLTERVCSVVVLDVSDSVSDESLEQARAEVEKLVQAKPDDDELRLVTFAARPRLVSLEHEDKLVVPEVSALRHAAEKGKPGEAPERPGAATNIQSALQLAYGVFPPGYLKRVLLITDGMETEGDLLAESNRARSFGALLSVHPLRRPPPAEISVTALGLPDKVDLGQTFDVRASIYASRASKARVRLFQGEALNGLDAVRDVDLTPGHNEIPFKSVVRVGGEVTYKLDLDPRSPDTFEENNSFVSSLDVPGRPLILYIEGQPKRASYLSAALTAQGFDMDVREPSGFPGSLREMERFDLVIVSDTPRAALGPGAEDLIERYVRDLGGGLLFAGGAAGYGLGGWAHSTVERLLPVRMDAEHRKEMPGVAMALIIDRSGSMTGPRIEMAKEACVATLSTLRPDDLIEVIAFDSDAERYVNLQPVRYRGRIQSEIQRIQAGGGTEIFPALDLAYQDLSVAQARKKHAVLLTDGQSSSTQNIVELAQAMLAESITVTTVGLGTEINMELLRAIADAGGGRFHHAPDEQSLPKIFTRETELVSQQAAVEEWFPVEQVAPADFLKGLSMSSAPLLHGYVATQLKPPPAQLVLQSDRGEPILARWRAGLGWAVAWTSDVKNAWAVEWLRWPGFGKFWGQLAREHMRTKRQNEVAMQAEVEGNRVRAEVDAFTKDERFDNGWESQVTLKRVGSNAADKPVTMSQIAPGRYQADLEMDGFGSFLLRATHNRRGKDGSLTPVGVSYAHVSHPYPLEYARFEPDLDRLSRAALAGGGKVDPDPKALFDPAGEHIRQHRGLYDKFVMAALVAFLLDLLMRRVRLFDRKRIRARPRPRRA